VKLIRALLMLIALAAAGAQAQTIDRDSGAAFRIALVTAAPGEIYWQRFGHNAILVENTVTGDARLYNFGIFDFEQKNFLLNFVQGRMLYRLAVFPPQLDLENYASEGRSVWVQELNLRPEQRYAVAEMLGQNALPENAEYRYDYFAQNCSTKVRDVLDAVLEGDLKETMSARARGETYRSLAMAYARPEPWLAVGIDLGIGPAADRKLSFWDEMFLPLRVRDLVREMRVVDEHGVEQPLVAREWTAYNGRLTDAVPPQPNWLWLFAIAGLALAVAAVATLRARAGAARTLGAALLALTTLLLGLGGLVLAGLWGFTDHAIAYANLNLVLFSPLALLLVWPLWRWRKPDAAPGTASRWTAVAVAVIALLGLAWLTLPGTQQANAHWFALILPLQLVLAWRFWFASNINDRSP
jgi:hypothetical protein